MKYARSWALNFVAKKAFILAHIDIKHPKRVLLQRTRSTQRSYSKQCFFIIENEKINVCQDFFCRTLSISPGVIANAIKQRNSFGQYAKEQEPRGRREPPNKTSPEAVNDVKRHIASFPSMESHYVRKKTKRQYIQAGLTLSKMYSLYENECKEKNVAPAVSEMTYRRIFCTEFNLGFYVPKKDQCILCNKFKQASGESRTNLKKNYDHHIKRKQDCNKEKENDKKRAEQESNFMSVTFDLQAILQIPASGQLDSQHKQLGREEPSTSQCNQSAEINNPEATPESQPNLVEEQRKSQIPRKRTVPDLSRLVNKAENVADSINTRMPTETETEFDIFGKSQLDSQHKQLGREEPSTYQFNQSAEMNNPDATPESPPNQVEEEKRKSPIPRKRTVRDLSRLVNKAENVADSINTRMPTETETEFDIFGKSVAAQLKSLPIHKAVEGQRPEKEKILSLFLL
ncbi:unnamed protein product [Colias eurytheme]|nr:unnamed protein product [Colias eurytheme]